MTIQEFAATYRTKPRLDSCGEAIIPGKPRKAALLEDRNHIFEYGSGRFGVSLLLRTARHWNNARKRLVAGGFTVTQNGDTEGTLTFDPTDEKQSRAAIRAAGIRSLSLAQIAQRAANYHHLRVA